MAMKTSQVEKLNLSKKKMAINVTVLSVIVYSFDFFLKVGEKISSLENARGITKIFSVILVSLFLVTVLEFFKNKKKAVKIIRQHEKIISQSNALKKKAEKMFG